MILWNGTHTYWLLWYFWLIWSKIFLVCFKSARSSSWSVCLSLLWITCSSILDSRGFWVPLWRSILKRISKATNGLQPHCWDMTEWLWYFYIKLKRENGRSLSDAFIMQENSNILSKEGELILEINQRVETNGRVEFCFGFTLKSYSDLLQ